MAVKNNMRTLTWFKNRIGKRIYRDKTSCNCETCARVYKEGLIVNDLNHAEYLEMVSREMNINYYNK